MNLMEISFPVFKLGNKQPTREGSLIFYTTESYNKTTEVYKERVKIVDDTSIDQPTLSRRRLKLAADDNTTLFPIRTAVYFLGDLVKLGGVGTWWIDSLGTVFEYKKTTRAKLKFYKLEKCFTTQGMGAVVQVCGLPQRFKTMFLPKMEERWCGVLECEGMHIFYGYYTQPHKETWRMI